MRKVHNPQLAQNTVLAVLFLSVAIFNSLFPPPTFSVVDNESATSWDIFALWTSRFCTRVVWSSEISSMERSAVLYETASAFELGERAA